MSELAQAIGARVAEREAARPARQTLGQEDFLTLLVTQLRNQDPLNPLNNEAFVAQLAQFATVSGITGIGKGIDALSERTGALARLQATALLGRTVAGPDGQARTVSGIAFGSEGQVDLQLEDGATLPAAAVTRIV